MKIKVIATGSSRWERFMRRWGISFLLGEDIMFDTFGDSRVFLDNLRRFKVDTGKIKHVVLSHDDWDHVTGLWDFLQGHKDTKVYICPGFRKEIKDKIQLFGGKIVEADKVFKINDYVYLTGELYGESDGRSIYEQSVVVKTAKGLAVICGCAHPGVVNIVRHVNGKFPDKVYALIGGFHLKNNTKEANVSIIKELKNAGISKIAPMHCTGKEAEKIAKGFFGDNCIKIREGDILDL